MNPPALKLPLRINDPNSARCRGLPVGLGGNALNENPN